ncbi:hypothetical protein J3R04_002557 [Spirilliplanes yamanashiensis]|nr:hypothetical protein [Spirilliplanes yamanashiensis]
MAETWARLAEMRSGGSVRAVAVVGGLLIIAGVVFLT